MLCLSPFLLFMILHVRKKEEYRGEREMDIFAILDELQNKALQDEEIRKRLLATRLEEHPLTAFCAEARKQGYSVYEMDLACAGEEFYATMRRSTNGGGENSPKLEWEDDFYELFMASLENKKQRGK